MYELFPHLTVNLYWLCLPVYNDLALFDLSVRRKVILYWLYLGTSLPWTRHVWTLHTYDGQFILVAFTDTTSISWSRLLRSFPTCDGQFILDIQTSLLWSSWYVLYPCLKVSLYWFSSHSLDHQYNLVPFWKIPPHF